MNRSKADLLKAANDVKAAGDGQNTKDRIGGLFYDTIEHLNEDPAKVVTSSTSGLKIVVATALPANPLDDTIYIIQQQA